MPHWLNPPNFLSFVRIALTPAVAACILSNRHRDALLLLAAAAVTDGADGFLARHYGWTTPFGAYLDPIADKLLLAAAYVALGLSGGLPVWLVILVFARDLLILSAAAALMATVGARSFPPSVWGKISTLLQVLTALGALAQAAVPELPGAPLEVLIHAAAAATIGSGLHYLWRGARIAREAIEARK